MCTAKVQAIFDEMVAEGIFTRSPQGGIQMKPRQSKQIEESIPGPWSNGLEKRMSKCHAEGLHTERGGPKFYISLTIDP